MQCKDWDGAKVNQEKVAAQAMLEQWQKSIGAEQRAAFYKRMPHLSDVEVVPVPHGDLIEAFEVDNAKPIEKAKVACAWAMDNSHTQLGTLLSRQWDGQHVMLEPKHCAPLQKSLPGTISAKKSPCCVAGVCLCCPAGKMLSKLYNRFAKLLKEKFKSRDSKILLAIGKVVVRFCNHPGIPCTDWLQASSQHADLQLFVMGIPLMHFKPYRPTFQMVVPTRQEVGIFVGTAARAFVKVERETKDHRGGCFHCHPNHKAAGASLISHSY